MFAHLTSKRGGVALLERPNLDTLKFFVVKFSPLVCIKLMPLSPLDINQKHHS